MLAIQAPGSLSTSSLVLVSPKAQSLDQGYSCITSMTFMWDSSQEYAFLLKRLLLISSSSYQRTQMHNSMTLMNWLYGRIKRHMEFHTNKCVKLTACLRKEITCPYCLPAAWPNLTRFKSAKYSGLILIDDLKWGQHIWTNSAIRQTDVT